MIKSLAAAKWNKAMIGVVVAVLLLGLLSACSSEPKKTQSEGEAELPPTPETVEPTLTKEPEIGPEVSLQAPDFTLKDLEGKTISLSQFRGKTVLLNFWASWCGPCRAEMPHLQKFFEESGDDLTPIGVNLMEDRSQVERFAQKQGLTFPIALDLEGKVGSSYKVRSIPTTFFIDPEGIIRGKKVGMFGSEEEIRSMLEDVMP